MKKRTKAIISAFLVAMLITPTVQPAASNLNSKEEIQNLISEDAIKNEEGQLGDLDKEENDVQIDNVVKEDESLLEDSDQGNKDVVEEEKAPTDENLSEGNGLEENTDKNEDESTKLDEEEKLDAESTEKEEDKKEEDKKEEDTELEDQKEEVDSAEKEEDTELEAETKVQAKSGDVYETIKVDIVTPYSADAPSVRLDREEFRLKNQETQSKVLLVTKTDSNYEIVLSNDDSYTFLATADTIEEATNIANSTPTTISENSSIPCVIDNTGQVVYSTKSMGRIWKHKNGVGDQSGRYNTNMFPTSDLSRAYTYVNQGYVDDVPVIQDLGKVAQVQAGSYIGWVNKDTSAADFDLLVYPVNKATNPSHYYVSNGLLYHFVSSNFTATSQVGSTTRLGPAPSYLKSGTMYFSYDGNYFYNGSNITTGLDRLITDLQNGNQNNAVNKGNPFYNYFQYLPFRSKTVYTADEINNFINDNTKTTSLLRGLGQTFIDAQNKYGVNAALALGVAINESGWGQEGVSQSTNNLFGMGAVDFMPDNADKFNKPGDSVYAFSKEFISRGYADVADWRYFGGFVGNKYRGANVKYASDPYWGEKACAHAFSLDYYNSGYNINNLRDYDSQKLIMFTGDNTVVDKNGNWLYDITTNMSVYGGYPGTVAVLSDVNEKYINGSYWLEINPERTTPVNSGGEANKFHGNYTWDSKARVKANNIQFINGNTYTDWKGHWAYKEIRDAMNKNWINKSNYVRPDDSITRAEFLKVVNRAFGFSRRAGGESFKDVSSSDWFYHDILVALKAGYIDKNNENFRPKDPITREEVAIILGNILKKRDQNLDKIKKYKDYNSISPTARTSVEAMVENKFMGVNSDYFRPKYNITRAEAIVTLSRIAK